MNFRRQPNFEPDQLQQFESTAIRLRQSNRKVWQVLLHTGYRRSEFREDAKTLTALARLMGSLLDLRNQLLVMAREQRPNLIIITVRGLCSDCPGTRLPPDRREDHRQGLKFDPAWHEELERVLEVATRAQDRILSHCRVREVSRLSSALSLVVRVLLREQRHLREMVPPEPPEIKVVDDPNRCCQCNKPLQQEDGEMTSACQI